MTIVSSAAGARRDAPHAPASTRPDYPDPLWLQAAELIAVQVSDGRLAAGSRLPPERELCAQLGISRVTLRKALGKLVADGVLRSSHGRGWYVAAVGEHRDWPNNLESFTETARRMGLAASSRVLRAETAPATLDEGEALGIAPGIPVFHLHRVRMLDAVPIAMDDALVPAAVLPPLDAVDFGTASLYELLAAAGLDLVRAESTIEAQEADAVAAANLGVAPGAPMLVLRQLVVDSADRPIFTSLVRYAGDRYRLRTSFSRSSR